MSKDKTKKGAEQVAEAGTISEDNTNMNLNAGTENAEAPGTDAPVNEMTAAEKLKKAQEEIKALREQVKKEKEAKKAAPKSEAYTRLHSIADVIRSGEALTKDEIATKANALYMEKGGKDNMTESKGYTARTLTTLELLPGVTTITEGKYTFNLPAQAQVESSDTTGADTAA